MANGLVTNGGGAKLLTALRVYGPAGAAITAALAEKSVSGTLPESGELLLELPGLGVWTLTVVNGTETITQLAKIDVYGITECHIGTGATVVVGELTPESIGLTPDILVTGNTVLGMDGEAVVDSIYISAKGADEYFNGGGFSHNFDMPTGCYTGAVALKAGKVRYFGSGHSSWETDLFINGVSVKEISDGGAFLINEDIEVSPGDRLQLRAHNVNGMAGDSFCVVLRYV